MTQGSMAFRGTLGIEHKSNRRKAPLAWRIRNALRPGYLYGLADNQAAKIFTGLTGIPTITAELSLVHHKRDGTHIDHGVVGYRVVTTAFVNFLVDMFQTDTTEIGDFKFHDSGVGTTAEAIGDTAMETTDGESRSTGTQTETSSNIYRSVGTLSYTTTKAITEHGVFSQVTGGTLMDRTVFSAVNVVNGDSISFTYSLTLSSGG